MNNEPPKTSPPAAAVSSRRHPDDNKYKRKDAQPGHRAAGKMVAAVEGGQPPAKFQKGERKWKPKITFEQMLNAPCTLHSGLKPATHTTR